jgi:hypothetical protein
MRRVGPSIEMHRRVGLLGIHALSAVAWEVREAVGLS